MKNIFFLLISTFSLSSVFSQITVNTTQTPAQLVTNSLVGPGITVSNITYTGQTNQRGYFNASTGCNLGITEGVMLSSGRVTDCVPPNQPDIGQFGAPGDPDLLTVAQSVTTNPSSAFITATEDAAILEFDFVPDGNNVTFNFVFASEEYTTYINTSFNDAFGFFVSGPGFTGPFASPAAFPNGAVNLALVPGTALPITISTIHPGLNSSYYVGTPVGHSFNGFTVPIQISFQVQCGETYHFKFAVADCQDDYLDTGVFLEAGSFNSLPADFEFNSYTINNVIYEDCDELATLLFTRQNCDGNNNDTLIAYLSYAGTATNGADYQLLGDSVVFLPGVDSIYWQIIGIPDGITEPQETIIVTIANIIGPGDTLFASGTFYIADLPTPIVTGFDQTYLCIRDSAMLSANVTSGITPYTYLWSTGDTTISAYVPILQNGTQGYEIVVTDICGSTASDSVYITVNQTISIDTILMGPATCEPVGWVSAVISGQTNPINITFDWTNANDTNIVYPDQSALPDLGGGWYILTLTDDNIPCSVTDSVFVETINTPQAIASVSPSSGCSPVTSIFSNDSQNATTYTWDFGNGNIITTSDMSDISQTYYSDAMITLTASNGNPVCDNTATLFVQVVTCGCMDPEALNYNPLAVLSGEECIYPTPTVIAPNVITANGDNINPFFFLETTNAETIELTIINRWGNVLYTGNGSQLTPPFWNATDMSGKAVEDGVYFYRYKVTGKLGDTLEGHGFLEVVR